MKWILAIALLASSSATGAAGRRSVLHDPVTLNIGINCQWQPRCMIDQRAAMNRALAFVAAHKPPHSQIHLCNRNASRGGVRMDWIGYENCIRNRKLKRVR